MSDLGLSRSDVPVSSESRIVYLVDPALNRVADLQSMLATGPAPAGPFQGRPFEESEMRALTAPGRPGNTAAYDAVADVAEHFFKFMFTQVSLTDRTLHRLVQEVNRVDFPLAVFDAAPRLLARENGGQRHLETRVTIRVFMVHLETDREHDVRSITRCELCFEDSAVGKADLPAGKDPCAALAASVVDGLRGKLASSFAYAPALRRSSGRVDEARRDLIDRSIAEGIAVEKTENRPAAAAGSVPGRR